MRAELHTVERKGPGKVSIMARPQGGEWLADEIGAWRDAGVALVVSLLTPEENAELGLGEEAALCEQAQMGFLAFPIPDRGTPAELAEATRVIDEIVSALRGGKHVALHCRAGIGRSAMMAAAALVTLGETPEGAFSSIGAARGWQVPDTLVQREWVERYALLQGGKRDEREG